MPLKEAAAVLGVSKDAVRQRVRRKTLRSDKGEDGRVYVYLDASVDDVHDPPDSEASGAVGDDPLHQQMQARIDDLRDQLRREQDAHAEARRVILALTSRIPQLEAPLKPPSEAREPDLGASEGAGRGDVPREALESERELRERAEEKAAALEGELREFREMRMVRESLPPPERVEEESERAGPRSTAAEEASERPQLRNGWREPVDKRPWWPYVLGLVAMVVGVAANNLEYSRWNTQFVWTSTWLGVPSSLGIWVGFRQRYVRVWRREVPLGAILGAVFVSIMLLFDPNFAFRLFSRSTIEGTLFCAYIIAPWLLLYVSGVLIGNARQRRLTGRRTGITPGSPLTRTTEGSTGSGTGWTPRKQAILGFVGTVLAALLGFMGTIVGAIMASGG
jgi:hypothetical protein